MTNWETVKKLNAGTGEERLEALEGVAKAFVFPKADARYINNHIHSIYSFSPYSPTAAAFMAKANGLCTAGIMDHDSMGGAKEFIAAGEMIGIPTTVGVEFRVSMANTPLASRKTNNPDQAGVSYMTLHGVPHDRIDAVQERFAPLRQRRNVRNKKMLEAANRLVSPLGVSICFEDDVLPLSNCHDGGSVTERHLMFALSKALIEKTGRGAGLIAALEGLDIALGGRQKSLLLDEESEFYEYDLLGVLKSAFIPKIFVPATDECMGFEEAIRFGEEIGGILCYPYLGDIEESVTGDKAAQKFEDEYLDELFEVLEAYGVKAITYMPPRNTRAQLLRLRELCKKHGMYEISGEDINSPRQAFVCKAMEDPVFANLIDAAWALIRHERGEKKISLK
ncbi:PHP domain-containing protein [Christensenellaceae bacterium OttesenSCG-928-M15]|nr:PHP domain-containing protein [Christensenellaceae bacterium OttesenSCG-928-M15]